MLIILKLGKSLKVGHEEKRVIAHHKVNRVEQVGVEGALGPPDHRLIRVIVYVVLQTRHVVAEVLLATDEQSREVLVAELSKREVFSVPRPLHCDLTTRLLQLI